MAKRVKLTTVTQDPPLSPSDVADIQSQLSNPGYAVVKIVERDSALLSELLAIIKDMVGANTITSALFDWTNLAKRNPVLEHFERFKNPSGLSPYQLYRNVFIAAHGHRDLLPSKDALLYWSPGQSFNAEGPPHLDTPAPGTPEGSSVFQGMLLLTDQSARTGGFAVAPPPGRHEPIKGANMLVAADATESRVIPADKGCMIIWNSTKWHHGKNGTSPLTSERAALLLAFNPPLAAQSSNLSHQSYRQAWSHSGWAVGTTTASFSDIAV